MVGGEIMKQVCFRDKRGSRTSLQLFSQFPLNYESKVTELPGSTTRTSSYSGQDPLNMRWLHIESLGAAHLTRPSVGIRKAGSHGTRDKVEEKGPSG